MKSEQIIKRGKCLTDCDLLSSFKLVGDRTAFSVQVGNTEGNLDCVET
jgi:hypothetical protein